nr:serine/threonine-protein kinase sty46 [Quercus suber]
MSSDTSSGGDSTGSKVGVGGGGSTSVPPPLKEKQKEKEKARVSRTSSILWHAHQNDAGAVRKLLEEDRTLVHARDYDNRTPLHVASLHGWIEVAKCLIDYGADVNAQDRWKNTPLADAEGAKKHSMIELLKSYGGLSYGQNGSHFEPKPVPPPQPNKCDWEIDPSELDFSTSAMIGKGSFGEILKACWRGTPVAVKRILPSLSDDRLVIQDFRHEVNLLVKLRHPNIVQFLGAVTEKKPLMLITEYLRGGQNGSHFEPKPVPPPQPNKCDWEIDPSELDFSTSAMIGKGSFGEILKACWRGTPVAVKRILPSLSDDRLVIQDFRHEVNLLVKLRHPNIVQFLGAVTEKKPLMLITEYLRGGDLHQYLKEKGSLSPSTSINFALDIARGMAYLHNEPNVIIHRDLKPRNVLLVNSSADHLKVGDFGLSKLIKVQNTHDVYKMTGETGSYRYMAPEVFKHRRYDKKVDVFSFAMILYEMLEGDPPLANLEPYEAAKYVSEGNRPTFRSKGYIPELRELTEQCWAHDMNQRPPFLDILKRLEKIKENLPTDHHWNIFNT